ncbi:MAG: hypothetical protein IT324_04985 [Anaerolineae bacterium]|nr:hypothetical protein [Anaerolineae bacterium]
MDNPDAMFNSPRYGIFMPSKFSPDENVVLVTWNSEEGLNRLCRSKFKQSFYQLVHHFQPQINPLYCGIATAVILLNAMRLPKGIAVSQRELEVQRPAGWGGDLIPFPSYSQLTFLNSETDQVKLRSIIRLENASETNPDNAEAEQFDPGLSLDELSRMLEIYGVQVALHYAAEDIPDGSNRLRRTVKSVLGSKDRFVIVNFLGHPLGAPTGGHISLLGAYDSESDAVLVIDVAAHKNPWYWVPLTHLYQSMHLMTHNLHRGWLVVSDGLEGKLR